MSGEINVEDVVMTHSFGWWFIISLLVVVPLWRIYQRAGLNPALSLLVLIPWVGGLVVLAMLAFSSWPARRGGVMP